MAHEIDILHHVPFNTQQHYVRAITKDGCEVYLPVDTRCPHSANFLQASLQKQLNEQDIGVLSPAPLEPIA